MRPQAAHGVPNEARFGVSQVIAAGSLAYVAGQIAREADGSPTVTADLEAHVDRAVANLDSMLGAIGLGRDAVVWVESHVVDEPERLAVVHPRWFEPGRTAGVIVPIDGLYDPAYRVEITSIATTEPAMPRTALPPADPRWPFAAAVRTGDVIHVSGHHGVPSDGPPGDVAAQFARALDRVLTCVADLGGTADDLVSSHIYTTRELSADEIAGIADAHRARMTGDNRPTSNLIGVRRLLHPDASVEVCGVAVVD